MSRPPSADPKQPHSIVLSMSPGPRQLNKSYHRHATPELAAAEAERLARVKPGTRFGVYNSGPSFKVPAPDPEAQP